MGGNKVVNFLRKYMMLIAMVVVMIVFFRLTDGTSLFPQNINNVISQNAYVFVLGTGMLLCILTGGNIDLSTGSVVCFVGAVGATLMENKGVNVFVSIILMVIVGIAIGAWQAFWIAYMHIPPFICTLSGMLVFRGLSNVVLQGLTVSLNNETFIKLFGGGAECYLPDVFQIEGFNLLCFIVGLAVAIIYVVLTLKDRIAKAKKGYEVEKTSSMAVKTVLICAVIVWFSYELACYRGIPTALIWVAIVVLVYGYITSNTKIGRYFYAVGGNEKATKLSGIDTKKVFFRAYTNMGFLSALAGMLTIARMTSAQPTYGQNYEMDAIGSCFIGGASAYGGVGTVPGVIVGAVLMGVINLGMSIMGTDANWQKVVKGLVLLAAVIFDVVTKKDASK